MQMIAAPAHDAQAGPCLAPRLRVFRLRRRARRRASGSHETPQGRSASRSARAREQGARGEAARRAGALLQSRDPHGAGQLAGIYAGQDQYEKARVALEQSIRTHPSYASAYENLGDVYAKLASQAYDKARKSMFAYPRERDFVVVSFDQDYRSDGRSNHMRKRQYWIREEGRWKILYEGAA
jgi:hypothetical protein